jgi:hypothetical protein
LPQEDQHFSVPGLFDGFTPEFSRKRTHISARLVCLVTLRPNFFETLGMAKESNSFATDFCGEK